MESVAASPAGDRTASDPITSAPGGAEAAAPAASMTSAEWRAILRPYEQPRLRASLAQVATSVVPYVMMLVLMWWSLRFPYTVTLLLAVPTAGFLMRTYIVFHDCAHTSMFRSRRANDVIGRICATFAFTPFSQWRHEHAMHHASAGDLDRRGSGDISTLTVDEYEALSGAARLRYRLYRHPLIMFVFGGLYFHVIQQRFVPHGARRRDRNSIHLTTLAIIAALSAVSWLIGPLSMAAIQVPVIALAGGIGVWLFYVQHQFEDAYWEHNEEWEYADAALQGSSHLKLPAVLQWFVGNINVHHVHHMSSRIPNYNLQRCHDENPMFHSAPNLALWQAVLAARLKLWDERQRRLITWRELREQRATMNQAATA